MADLKSLLGDKYTEGMTIEEILALEVEQPQADTSAYDNLKKRFDEVASEAANYKKQMRANLTEAEQKELANKETLEALTTQLEQLKLEKAITETAKGLVAIGYDEKSANDTATALHNGDYNAVIQAQAKFVETAKKSVLADAVKNTPTPPTDNGEKSMTKEEFKKLSLSEQTKLYNENKELYNELTK